VSFRYTRQVNKVTVSGLEAMTSDQERARRGVGFIRWLEEPDDATATSRVNAAPRSALIAPCRCSKRASIVDAESLAQPPYLSPFPVLGLGKLRLLRDAVRTEAHVVVVRVGTRSAAQI
jgi:hypothetical protein